MPNYYAHHLFGEQVLKGLPAPLRTRLEGERAAFELGCLGPDPLFFYRPLWQSPARKEGFAAHKTSALPTFQRLKAAVDRGVPQAGGYAAGYLCHLALDSGCHGWVNGRAAQGSLTHLAMEAEYDRLLLTRAGLDPLRRAHMPPIKDPAVFAAGSLAFAQVTPHILEKSYRGMRRYSTLMAKAAGTRLGGWWDRRCDQFATLRGAKGMVLSVKLKKKYTESNQKLEELQALAVPVAVEQVRRFFEQPELDPWLDRDFQGSGEETKDRPI